MAQSNDQRRRRKARGVAHTVALLQKGDPPGEIHAALIKKWEIGLRTAKKWMAEARLQTRLDDGRPEITQTNYEDERMRMATTARVHAATLYAQADVYRNGGETGQLYLRTLKEARDFEAHAAKLLHFHITPPDRLMSQSDVRDKLLNVVSNSLHFFTDGEIARVALSLATEKARRIYDDKAADTSDPVLENL